jgi:hypothetical protein
MGVDTGRAHTCRLPTKQDGNNNNNNNNNKVETHLLQLKLSPPSDVGIGIERCCDAALNGGGIHRGQSCRADYRIKSASWRRRFCECRNGREPKGLFVVVEGSPGSRKNLGQNLVAKQQQCCQAPPRMAGQKSRVGSGSVHVVLPQPLCQCSQPTDKLPGCGKSTAKVSNKAQIVKELEETSKFNLF